MQKGYIKGLDGLRAVAVIWVMFGHITPSLSWEANTFYHKVFVLFSNSNWVGVQLFFVISGFLITKILLNGKSESNHIKNFYIRRSLRIFPVYYFSLAFIFILLPLFSLTPDWLESETTNQWWFWAYLNNWSRPFYNFSGLTHLWSLAIEEQFYLVWPFIVVYLSKSTIKRICLLMIISAPLFRFILYYYAGNFGLNDEQGARAAYNFTFARWDAIALGAYLSLLMTDSSNVDWLKKYSKVGLISVLSVILVQITINHNFTSVDQGVGLLNQTTASIAFFFTLFLVLSNRMPKITHFLEIPIMKSIGKVSYAMYIFHLPLMILWMDIMPPKLHSFSNWQILPVVILYNLIFGLIVYALAKLSWHFLEYPFLKLKSKFSD